MPKTKLQSLVFTALMVFCMVYCMTAYNVAWQIKTLRITKSRTERSHSVRLFLQVICNLIYLGRKIFCSCSGVIFCSGRNASDFA